MGKKGYDLGRVPRRVFGLCKITSIGINLSDAFCIKFLYMEKISI